MSKQKTVQGVDKVRWAMAYRNFAKYVADAEKEDLEKFQVELRFTLEKDSNPNFGIDRNGFF